jgi:hypothetical protein
MIFKIAGEGSMMRSIIMCLILSFAHQVIAVKKVESLLFLTMQVVVKAIKEKKCNVRNMQRRQDLIDCMRIVKDKQNLINYAQWVSTLGIKEEENTIVHELSKGLVCIGDRSAMKVKGGKIKGWVNKINEINELPKNMQSKIWDARNKITLRAAQAE